MGEVYRAHDARLSRDVAIKVLRAEALSDRDHQRRFATEARAASALNHPNLLTVYDVGMHDSVPYIVTEFVDGETLRSLLAKGPLPVRKVLDIAIQVSGGLAAAHAAGIAHRDLKPANLMITRDGFAKILDFGLAKPLHSRAAAAGGGPVAETLPGFIVGTAAYMSPEQVKGESLDHRTDQFSFGLVLWEMLTGKPAFARASAVSTMAAIVDEQPQSLIESVPGLPPPFRWCIERCLEKDREGRYNSTADLHRELQILRARLEESTSSTARPALPARPVRKIRPLLAALLAVLVLAAGVLLTAALGIPRAAVDLAAYRIRPIATSGEFARSPVWSPDGNSLAFTAVVKGVRQVFVRELSSSMAGQITQREQDCERPFWAPDESRIFFLQQAAGGPDLYSVGATGGSPELVERNVFSAALSPNGQTLAFLRSDPTGKVPLALWARALSGRSPRRITARPFDSARYQSGYLAFSPDSRRLGAWLSRWDGASEVWILPWPDGSARQSYSMAEQAFPFSWMPDSRQIVFGGVVPGSIGADLQLLDSRNGRLRPISAMTKDTVEASASPDGKRIAFVSSQDDFDLLTVPLDGSAPGRLLGTNRSEFDPTWAPTHDQIAYSTDRTGSWEIWVRNVQDGWERPLVTGKEFGRAWIAAFREANFSPDGRRIAYSVAGSTGHAVYISNVTGGKPARLSSDAADERSPSWNGDGSWIAYLRNSGGTWQLVKAPSGGGSRPVVLRDACLPSHPKWNRGNSHWIACVTMQGLTLVSADGTETLALSPDHWQVYGWDRDGQSIYGVKLLADGRRMIASLNIAARAEKLLGELSFPATTELRGFSLSPDGKSFTTSASQPSGDLWVLEGFRRPGLLGRLP
jgi:Tol biopolymer transport system component